MLGAARVWFAVSRDGLLPRWFAHPHPSFRTPYRPTAILGVATALVAGLFPITAVAELVNIGVLTAFIIVCASVWILRRTRPEIQRSFHTPLVPIVPLLGIIFSIVLIASLPPATWVRFAIWLAIGLAIFFLYSRRHSLLARGERGIERDMPA